MALNLARCLKRDLVFKARQHARGYLVRVARRAHHKDRVAGQGPSLLQARNALLQGARDAGIC